jgi:hypothetical protein
MTALYSFPAHGLLPLETAKPQYANYNAGTILVPVWRFDQTTQEYVNGNFTVHPSIDATGTVTIGAKVSPVTGEAAAFVGLRLGHRNVGDGVTNGSYTDVDSGDKSITPTTGNETLITWTVLVSTLTWAASQSVYFRLSRYVPTGNNLDGDMRLHHFFIRIPLV